ncbi:hypothetical protein ACFQ6U_35960, partial [Streptomyces sp. NPDC056465]|uniref:hypothetical protein n=1 Tax=Streptomyces sp. NPDC056465 TaxID=3345829 RepID=UPI00368E3591
MRIEKKGRCAKREAVEFKLMDRPINGEKPPKESREAAFIKAACGLGFELEFAPRIHRPGWDEVLRQLVGLLLAHHAAQ